MVDKKEKYICSNRLPRRKGKRSSCIKRIRIKSDDTESDKSLTIISEILGDDISNNSDISPYNDVFTINQGKETLTLTEKIQIGWSPELYSLCHKSKNLYNFSNFITRKIFHLYKGNSNVNWNDFLIIRENILPNTSIKNYAQTREKILETFERLRNIIKYRRFSFVGNILSTLIKYSKFYTDIEYAASAQQINRILGQNWKSFKSLLELYYKGKLNFRPNIPRYKPKDGEFMIVYPGQTFQTKESKNHIINTKRTTKYKKFSTTTAELLFPKKHRNYLPSIRVRYDILKNIREVRIVPKGIYYEISIVYSKSTENYNLCDNNALSIDLGSNIILAIANNLGLQPVLIQGRQLKQVNHIINKKSPPLKSIISICKDILKKYNKKGNTKSIVQIIEERHQKYIDHYKLIEYLVNIQINNPNLTYDHYIIQNYGDNKIKQIFNHIKVLLDDNAKCSFLNYQFTDCDRKQDFCSEFLKKLDEKPSSEHNEYINYVLEKNQRSLNNLYKIYNNKIRDAIHKMSRYIIKMCEKNNIGTIIIGYSEGWKSRSNLSKSINRKFIPLPFHKLINLIKYKAQLIGINIIIVDESYTSKCSALDKESIKFHEKYAGERNPEIFGKDGESNKHYGQFYSYVSKKYIHADINAAFNIGRKGSPQLFEDVHPYQMLIPPIRIAVS